MVLAKGMFSVGIIRLYGKANTAFHKNIIEENGVLSLRKCIAPGSNFMRDNAHGHTVKTLKQFIGAENDKIIVRQGQPLNNNHTESDCKIHADKFRIVESTHITHGLKIAFNHET